MTLRKISIDNSVTNVSKDDHSHNEKTSPISKERNKMFPIKRSHKRIGNSLKV